MRWLGILMRYTCTKLLPVTSRHVLSFLVVRLKLTDYWRSDFGPGVGFVPTPDVFIVVIELPNPNLGRMLVAPVHCACRWTNSFPSLGVTGMRGKLLLPEHYGVRTPSPRQLRVIELVAQGFKNCEIAGKLGIGPHVVRNHLSNIYDKIGVSNRVELALWYEARMHERAEIERMENKKTKPVDKPTNLSSWQGTLSA